jgi:hypothetical protein
MGYFRVVAAVSPFVLMALRVVARAVFAFMSMDERRDNYFLVGKI